MVDDTIHVMDAKETLSEAAGNYAGAAFLVGMAIVATGVGIGIISGSIRKLRKAPPKSSVEDILERMRKNAHSAVEPTVDEIRHAAMETLRKATDGVLGGKTFDQVSSEEYTYYYVKKAYKDPIVVGTMIPEQFVVEKQDGMPMDVFMNQDNIKFKSRHIVNVPGGMNLIAVDEIINSEGAKPV